MKKFLISLVFFVVISGYSDTPELTLHKFFYKHTLLKGPELSLFIEGVYKEAELRREEGEILYISKDQLDYANRVMLKFKLKNLYERLTK